MEPYVEPGARWLRCDLHVHTPFDRTKRFGEDVKAAGQVRGAGAAVGARVRIR